MVERSYPDTVDALQAARKSIMAAGIGSCDCHTKTPDAAFHAAHCRYLKILSALDSLAIVEEGIAAPAQASGAPTAEDIYAFCYSTLTGFRDELTEQQIKFICDQVSRKVILAMSSTDLGGGK